MKKDGQEKYLIWFYWYSTDYDTIDREKISPMHFTTIISIQKLLSTTGAFKTAHNKAETNYAQKCGDFASLDSHLWKYVGVVACNWMTFFSITSDYIQYKFLAHFSGKYVRWINQFTFLLCFTISYVFITLIVLGSTFYMCGPLKWRVHWYCLGLRIISVRKGQIEGAIDLQLADPIVRPLPIVPFAAVI